MEISTTPPGSPNILENPLKTAPTTKVADVLPQVQPQKRYVPDADDQQYVKRVKSMEVDISNRIRVCRATDGREMNFSYARTLIGERLRPKHQSQSQAPQSQKNAAAAPQASSVSASAPQRKKRVQAPIILVPSSSTSLITLDNVKSFLEDANFQLPATARKENGRSEHVVLVYRKKEGGKTEKFVIVDGVEALVNFGEDAWDRVVCVVTNGQAWQFKGFKWEFHRELFHHVKGFSFSFAQDQQNTKIADWNIESLVLNRDRRHIDKSTVARFWKSLESWIALHKPALVQ